jgi:hypothetical protein
MKPARENVAYEDARKLVASLQNTRSDLEMLDTLYDVDALLANAVQSCSTLAGTDTDLTTTSKGENVDVDMLDG